MKDSHNDVKLHNHSLTCSIQFCIIIIIIIIIIINALNTFIINGYIDVKNVFVINIRIVSEIMWLSEGRISINKAKHLKYSSFSR